MNPKTKMMLIRYSLCKIYQDFYRDKAEKIIAKQKQIIRHGRIGTNGKNIIELIKEYFPNATITESTSNNRTLIKLSNVDFYISNNQLLRNRIVIKDFGMFTDEIPNVVSFIYEINNKMPEWEKEFAIAMAKLERQTLPSYLICNVSAFIAHKVNLHIFNCRKNTEAAHELQKTLDETKVSFKNIQVGTNENSVIIYLKEIGVRKYFYDAEITIEQLAYIDKMIPIWTEECSRANIEYEKQNKSNEIRKLSVIIFVKAKMESLGYEYYIEEGKNSLSLYVKLSNVKMLKLSLPYRRSVATIQKRLLLVEETFASINNAFYTLNIIGVTNRTNVLRICNINKPIKWIKATTATL